MERGGRALRVFAPWGGAGLRLEDDCLYVVRGTEALETDAATGDLRVRFASLADGAVLRAEGRAAPHSHQRPPAASWLPLREVAALPAGSPVNALTIVAGTAPGGAATLADSSYESCAVLAPAARPGQMAAILNFVARAGGRRFN